MVSVDTLVSVSETLENRLGHHRHCSKKAAGVHSMSEILEAICKFVDNAVSGCDCILVLVDPGGTRHLVVASRRDVRLCSTTALKGS